MAEPCGDCEGDMNKVGEYKNTRLFICSECFAVKVEYVTGKCKHEYVEKNGNKCTQCGEQ